MMTIRRNWVMTLWAVLLTMGVAMAQETHSIRADRPGQMTGPRTIGPDRIQVEWGVGNRIIEQATTSGRSFMTDALIRWSPAEKWELRGTYAFIRTVGNLGGFESRALTNYFDLGARYQFVNLDQHQFAMQLDVQSQLRNEQINVGARVWALYSFLATDWLSLNTYLTTTLTDLNVEGVINAGFQLSPTLSLYGETKYLLWNGLRFQNVGGGLAWLASPMLQLDLHLTSDFLPSTASQNWTVGGGVAYAIQY